MIVGVMSVIGLVGDGVMIVIGWVFGEGVIEMNMSVFWEMGGVLVIVEIGNVKIVIVEIVMLIVLEESVIEMVVIVMIVMVIGLVGGVSV